MSADLELVGMKVPIELPEIAADEGAMGFGEAVSVHCLVTGDTVLRDITVGLIGEGANVVQLAADERLLWAEPGEQIVIRGTFGPGDEITFWARATYGPETVEGWHRLKFVVDAESVGV